MSYLFFHYGLAHISRESISYQPMSLRCAQSIQMPKLLSRIYSVSVPDSIRSLDPDPDPGRQKWPTTIESAGCSLLRAEVFSCNLDVFYEGLGISNLQFLIKIRTNFFNSKYFDNFCSSKPWIRIRCGCGSGIKESGPETLIKYPNLASLLPLLIQ